MRKTNGIFVVQWSFEKLDFFFNYQSKKLAVYSRFRILKAILCLIYRKRYESMVNTFIFTVWEIKIFRLLRPSKTSEDIKTGLHFVFLTFM